MANSIQVDPDQVQAIAVDPSEVQPALSEAQGSAIERFAKGFWGNLVSTGQGMVNAVEHPLDTVSNIGKAQDAVRLKGLDALKRGDYVEAARHALNYAIPVVGPTIDAQGDQAQSGDVAGALGGATALGVQGAAPGALEANAATIVPRAADAASTLARVPKAALAGVKAGGPGVVGGAAMIAGGELMSRVPGLEWPARIGLAYPGTRQIAGGLKSGARAAMEELRNPAPEAPSAPAGVPATATTAGPAGESAAAPTATPGTGLADELRAELEVKAAASAQARAEAAISPGQKLAESTGMDWKKLTADDKAMMETVAKAQENVQNQPPAPAPAAAPVPSAPPAAAPASSGASLQDMLQQEFPPKPAAPEMIGAHPTTPVVPGGRGPLRPPLATAPQPAAPAVAPVDAENAADMMRELPGPMRQAAADANYRAVKEGAPASEAAPVYEAAARATKADPIAKALYEAGIPSHNAMLMGSKEFNSVAQYLRGQGKMPAGGPVSLTTQREVLFQLRRMEVAAQAVQQVQGGAQ
jgi:hypothetical protein